MSRTVILYGSTSGNTERIAKDLARLLDGGADVFSVSAFAMDRLKDYDRIILGASTWGAGDLQDDWMDALPVLARQDLSGKTIALFGLGDAEGYGDTFVDGMGELHAAVAESGARRIGFWSVDGYAFEASRAVENGRFVGLVLDEDNQSALTEDRLRRWAEVLQAA
jgi:flavodoxin I